MGYTIEERQAKKFYYCWQSRVIFDPQACKLIIKGKMKPKKIIDTIKPILERFNIEANWLYSLDGPIKHTVIDFGYSYDDPVFNGVDKTEDGMQRQLTCYINLTHPDDYDFGDLMIRAHPGGVEQGMLNVFPSWQQSCITPIKSGKRHALILWQYGKGGRGDLAGQY